MSQRKSILASEEAVPGSPLRRSSRIANSPAPAAEKVTPASAVTRRRNSATETTTASPAKVTRKRPSLSHEILLDTDDKKTLRAASKSPSSDLETKTPAKRGRKSSVSTIIEEETTVTKPVTPTRRRSVRGQSTSPSKDNPVDPPPSKPRGRRPSITQVSLEVIEETEKPTAPKGRATRTSRRTSIDSNNDETEAKPEEKLPTRRSTRRRSVDIAEETTEKTITELKPITEEESVPESELKPIEEEKTVEDESKSQSKTDDVIEKDPKSNSQPEKVAEKEIIPSTEKSVSEEELKLTLEEEATTEKEVEMIMQQENITKNVPKESKAETEQVPEEEKITEIINVDDDDDMKTSDMDTLDKSSKEQEKTKDKEQEATPKENKDKEMECIVVDDDDDIIEENNSLNLTLSPTAKNTTDIESQLSLELPNNDSPFKSPVRRSPRLSPKKSPVTRDKEDNETKIIENSNVNDISEKEVEAIVIPDDAENSPSSKTPSSPIVTSDKKTTPKEKESSLNKEDVQIIKSLSSPRRSLRLSESERVSPKTVSSRTLSSSSIEEKDTNKAKTDSENIVITSEPTKQQVQNELNNRNCSETFSDTSFTLNVSIPSCKSTDNEVENKLDNLDCSGSSNNSDKENSNKLNLKKSPRIKRKSLVETSTPTQIKNVFRVDVFNKPIELSQESNTSNKSLFKLQDENVSSQNESIVEIDNENEFGTSPIKQLKQKTLEDMEAELMSSFVDEVIDDNETIESQEVTQQEKNDDKTEADEIMETNTEKKAINTTVSDSTSTLILENGDNEIEAVKNKKTQDDLPLTSSKGKMHEPESAFQKKEETKEKVSPAKTQDANHGSKRRKIEPTLDDLINRKLLEVESDEDDEDYQPTNDFLDDMASEGEEDTPSENSNDIIDDGESLHSTDTEEELFSEEYENDSFVASDESVDLLSGNEYDLEMTDARPKRKSRIYRISDSSDELHPLKPNTSKISNSTDKIAKLTRRSAGKIENKTTPVNKAHESSSDFRKSSPSSPEFGKKVVILQDIKLKSPNKVENVVINVEDNLNSLESMKDEVNLEVPREPSTSLSTPNNSLIESSKHQRKSSISIQEQMELSRVQEGQLNDKLNNVLNYFVGSISDGTRGNVSLNVSLEYKAESAPGSPKNLKRVSLRKEDVEIMNDVVDQILETTVQETTAKSSSKKKRFSKPNVSIQDEFVVESEEVPKTNQSSKESDNLLFNEEEDADIDSDIVTDPIKSKLKKKRSSLGFKDKTLKSSDSSDMLFQTEDDEKIDNTSLVEGTKKKKITSKRLSQSLIEDISYEKDKSFAKEKDTVNLSLCDTEKNKKPKSKASGNKQSPLPQKEIKKKHKVDVEAYADVVPSKKARTESKEILVQVDEVTNSRGNKSEIKKSEVSLSSPKKVKKSNVAPIDKTKAEPSKLQRFPVELLMEVEEERNPKATKSETESLKESLPVKKKVKKIKPSAPDNCDYDGWEVETTASVKPSKRNKDKPSVQQQVETIKRKFDPNDFRNQMIYDSKVKRLDSKDIIKNKQKSRFASRQK